MYRRISTSHGLEPIKTYDQFSVLSAVFRVFFFFPPFFNFSSSNLNEFAWKKECFHRKNEIHQSAWVNRNLLEYRDDL